MWHCADWAAGALTDMNPEGELIQDLYRRYGCRDFWATVTEYFSRNDETTDHGDREDIHCGAHHEDVDWFDATPGTEELLSNWIEHHPSTYCTSPEHVSILLFATEDDYLAHTQMTGHTTLDQSEIDFTAFDSPALYTVNVTTPTRDIAPRHAGWTP